MRNPFVRFERQGLGPAVGVDSRCGEEKSRAAQSAGKSKEVIDMKNGYKWMGVYWLLVLILCVFATRPAMGESSGTTGASFLKIPVGPRAAAMGSAYTAVAEQPYALHYNPAALASERWELSAMHQDQFGSVRFDYFGLSAPAIKKRSSWGLSFIRLAIDDYARTETDDGIKFTNSDIAITGTYAHRIFKQLTLGVSGKIIKQTLSVYTANGWALDFGAHLKVNPRLSIGASVLHIGPKITFIAIGDPLPTTIRVGGAFKLLPRGNLLATLDYWQPKYDVDNVGIGVEYRPNRFVALRGGYQLGTDFTGFDASTYGVTFDFENFGMEYAFVPREKLGDVHRAGMNVSFGKKPQVIASAKPKKPVRRARDVARRSAESRAAKRPGTREPGERTARPASRPSSQPAAEGQSVRRPAPSRPAESTRPTPTRQPDAATSDMMSLRRSSVPAQSPVESRPRSTAAPVSSTPVPPNIPIMSEETLPPELEEKPVARPSMAPESPGQAPRVVESMQLPAEESRESKDKIVQEKIKLASSLMKEQRFMEASVIVRSALTVDPRNVPLWYLLSENLYRLGEYDNAMQAVNTALGIIRGTSAGGQ